MKTIFAFIGGLLFGTGLIIAGMANPAKVIGFLDIAGQWDPSLALVMAGAIAVGIPAFAYAKRRSTSLLHAPMDLPTERHVNRRLIAGSMLFGIGWGLAGVCPGPAFVLVGSGAGKGMIFCVAMLSGMVIFELTKYLAKYSRQP